VSVPKSADTYHHGDLRNALVGAATSLARDGGPDAVVLRAAARQVGVSPAAAYHHFANREQLVQAVKQAALAQLSEQMESALGARSTPPRDRGRPRPSAAEVARQRLRALGHAYLQFAFDEPGLFRLAFGPRGPWPTDEPGDEPTDEPTGPHGDGAGPFVLLRRVLDELAAAGAIPLERRAGLEYVTWAQVHGVGTLCLDGPLADIDASERQRTVEQALDAIIRGL
jgi:AcrR family transcriptional regulator